MSKFGKPEQQRPTTETFAGLSGVVRGDGLAPKATGPVERFCRLRRKGMGWIVEEVEIQDGAVVSRNDVHEWDVFQTTMRRLAQRASEQEMKR